MRIRLQQWSEPKKPSKGSLLMKKKLFFPEGFSLILLFLLFLHHCFGVCRVLQLENACGSSEQVEKHPVISQPCPWPAPSCHEFPVARAAGVWVLPAPQRCPRAGQGHRAPGFCPGSRAGLGRGAAVETALILVHPQGLGTAGTPSSGVLWDPTQLRFALG